jgi:DNA-binding NtrC family response regulator
MVKDLISVPDQKYPIFGWHSARYGCMARRVSILLVDDDSTVRQSLEQALLLEDYQVVSAANRSEALRGFGEHKIDVALLDVHLGEESGWDTCKDLRKIRPKLPVIMMTGHSDELLIAPAQPVEAFLEKPLDLALLIRKLAEFAAMSSVSATLSGSPVQSFATC